MLPGINVLVESHLLLRVLHHLRDFAQVGEDIVAMTRSSARHEFLPDANRTARLLKTAADLRQQLHRLQEKVPVIRRAPRSTARQLGELR